MFFTAAAFGEIYFVAPYGDDASRGTLQEPWRTIRKAADSLKAGDTVYIKAGTYRERVVPRSSGRAGAFIEYRAFPGDEVIVDGQGIILPEWESGLFDISDLNFIKVMGLRITNAGPHANNAGIYVDNSNHIAIEKNSTYNTVSSGIGVWNSSGILIDGNEVELACNDGEQECITIAGSRDFDIRNNRVHHGGPGTNGGEGIDVKDGSHSGKIHNNTVHHIRGDRMGIYLDAWDKHTHGIEVFSNIVYHCGAGISLASEKGGLLEGISIVNNILHENRNNGFEIGNWGEDGISGRPIKDVSFSNNTVYKNGSGDWGGGILLENPDARNILIRNNILSRNLTYQLLNETKLSSADLTVDHNLIDGFRGFEDEIRGTNTIEGKPLFADPLKQDFRLQRGSPAVDRGSPVNAPGGDFHGTPRPQGHGYDLGAVELVD